MFSIISSCSQAQALQRLTEEDPHQHFPIFIAAAEASAHLVELHALCGVPLDAVCASLECIERDSAREYDLNMIVGHTALTAAACNPSNTDNCSNAEICSKAVASTVRLLLQFSADPNQSAEWMFQAQT